VYRARFPAEPRACSDLKHESGCIPSPSVLLVWCFGGVCWFLPMFLPRFGYVKHRMLLSRARARLDGTARPHGTTIVPNAAARRVARARGRPRSGRARPGGRSRRARAGRFTRHYAQEVTCGVSTQCQTARAMSSLPSGNGVGHRAARAVLPVGRAVVFADQGRPGRYTCGRTLTQHTRRVTNLGNRRLSPQKHAPSGTPG